jgi:hypothetical protein
VRNDRPFDTKAARQAFPTPHPVPVSLRRKLTPDGRTQAENYEWLPFLADGVGKDCVGRDPMSIPAEVLTASGHPPRRARDLIAAFNKTTGGENFGLERVERITGIRSWCLACTGGNDAETRRCSTIHCPFWPYRMARNPHNPQRGCNPFKNGRAS